MAGSIWLQLGSLASIAMLVGISYALGFRGRRTLSDDAQLIALSERYGGAQDFAMDVSRTSAIAMLNDGRLLVCKAVGSATVSRVFSTEEIVSAADYHPKCAQTRGVSLQFKDAGFPSLKLEMAGEVWPLWLERVVQDVRKK